MHDTSRLEVVIASGHVESIGDQVGAHMIGECVSDHFLVETIDDGRKIYPSLPCSDVGDISDKFRAGIIGGEVTAHQIGRIGLVRASHGGSAGRLRLEDRKSTRLNSSHVSISYAVFCLKKKKT